MKKSDNLTKIISIIDRIRPYLVSDGGNLEFVDYKDNIVYVRMLGACQHCDLLDVTLNGQIAELIKTEVPDVKDVINVE